LCMFAYMRCALLLSVVFFFFRKRNFGLVSVNWSVEREYTVKMNSKSSLARPLTEMGWID